MLDHIPEPNPPIGLSCSEAVHMCIDNSLSTYCWIPAPLILPNDFGKNKNTASKTG